MKFDDRLTGVGRDIAAFAPDRHCEWADDDAQCHTPTSRDRAAFLAAVAERRAA